MRYFIGICCFFLLANCFADSDYTKSLKSWQGRSVKSVMKQFGQPNQLIETPEGNKILIYQKKSYRNEPTSGSPQIGVNVAQPGRPVIVTAPPPNSPLNYNQPPNLECETFFYANRNGIVTETKVKGYCW